MRITFLGFTLSDKDMHALLDSDPEMPIQTHTFAWNLVDALRAGGASVLLLSSDPVSNYPSNTHIVFRGGRFAAEGVAGRRLSFINLLALKHLTRFIACLTSGTRELRAWRPHVLLIHGVHSPYLWYGVIARRLTGTRTVVVLTDPPGVVLASDSLIVRVLRRLDSVLVRTALSRVDGVISLTSRLASDFAPNVPSITLEGFSSASPHQGQAATDSRTEVRVLYAGSLSPSSGMERLVTAFRRTSIPDVRLFTYGRGQTADWINAQSDLDSRIERVQFADRATVLGRYVDADLLVQPRCPTETFAPYSFPSKLLEYMASGTPVLSTRLPGIPAEYEPFLYWIEDDSVDGIETALERVLKITGAERREKGRAAAEFVVSSRSAKVQGPRIVAFLREICPSSPTN